MHIENLVTMLNQIESFFASDPDREAAISGIAQHVQKFWEPRMRRAILAHEAQGGAGLGELAREAVRRLPAVKAA